MVEALSWIIFFVWLAYFFARIGGFWGMIAGHFFVVALFFLAYTIEDPNSSATQVPIEAHNHSLMLEGIGVSTAVFIINSLLLPVSALGIYHKNRSEKFQFALSDPDGTVILGEIDN